MDEISVRINSEGKLIVTNGCILKTLSGYSVLPILEKYGVKTVKQLTPVQKDDLWAELLRATPYGNLL